MTLAKDLSEPRKTLANTTNYEKERQHEKGNQEAQGGCGLDSEKLVEDMVMADVPEHKKQEMGEYKWQETVDGKRDDRMVVATKHVAGMGLELNQGPFKVTWGEF